MRYATSYGVGLNHLPSGSFANGAWLAVQVMAHNLARWTARIGLQQIVTTKTLTTGLCLGRTDHPLGTPMQQFSRALARLRAPSLTAPVPLTRQPTQRPANSRQPSPRAPLAVSYPAISLATATVGRHRCPPKRLQTARQPPVYPLSPDHRACAHAVLLQDVTVERVG